MSLSSSAKTSSELPLCIAKQQVRVGRHTTVSFNRTLRIPEDGNTYPLPAGFGTLPIYRVSDYAAKVPAKWLEKGGFFIPLYQREALYLEFHGAAWRPTIAKVAVGMINAITGKKFDATLREHSQDYVVIPNQQWLDGINAEKGVVGQFVAMPLGKGYTIEEQVTDEAKHGGFQLMFYDSKDQRFPEEDPAITREKQRLFSTRHGGFLPEIKPPSLSSSTQVLSQQEEEEMAKEPAPDFPVSLAKGRVAVDSPILAASPRTPSTAPSAPLRRQEPKVELEMGIAAGGSIQQQIITDPYGANTWDASSATPLYIYMVNSMAFEYITGQKPPETPISAYSYKKRGIPWYSNYDERTSGVAASRVFKSIKSVFQIDKGRDVSHAEALHAFRPSLELLRRIHVPSVEQRFENLLAFASRAFNQQQYESTIRSATLMLDLAPDSSEALLLRARAYSFIGQHQLADMDSSLILHSEPHNVDALLVRAHANYVSGWLPQALEDAMAAVRLAPANSYARQLFNAVSQQSR